MSLVATFIADRHVDAVNMRPWGEYLENLLPSAAPASGIVERICDLKQW
jgi:hypothetical protein